VVFSTTTVFEARFNDPELNNELKRLDMRHQANVAVYWERRAQVVSILREGIDELDRIHNTIALELFTAAAYLIAFAASKGYTLNANPDQATWMPLLAGELQGPSIAPVPFIDSSNTGPMTGTVTLPKTLTAQAKLKAPPKPDKTESLALSAPKKRKVRDISPDRTPVTTLHQEIARRKILGQVTSKPPVEPVLDEATKFVKIEQVDVHGIWHTRVNFPTAKLLRKMKSNDNGSEVALRRWLFDGRRELDILIDEAVPCIEPTPNGDVLHNTPRVDLGDKVPEHLIVPGGPLDKPAGLARPISLNVDSPINVD